MERKKIGLAKHKSYTDHEDVTEQVFVKKLEDSRLLSTVHCSKCDLVIPNDIFSPFRDRSCQCGEKIIDKDGVSHYIRTVINREHFQELYIGRRYLLSLGLKPGVLKELKIGDISNEIKIIHLVRGFIKPDIPELALMTGVYSETIRIGLLNRDNTDICDQDKVYRVIVTIGTDTGGEDHYPDWERAYYQAIRATRKKEYSLAVISLQTATELFLVDVSRILLEKHRNIKPIFIDKLLERANLWHLKNKVLFQVCDNHDTGNHPWRDFEDKVTKNRKIVVHRDTELNLTQEMIIEAMIAVYSLVVHVLGTMDEHSRVIVLKNWNRNCWSDEVYK